MTQLGKVAVGVAVLILAAQSALLWSVRAEVAQLSEQTREAKGESRALKDEVVRLRIEQTIAGAGPLALLEKLRAYAPELASSRAAKPDYQWAQTRMDEVKRALGGLGQDAVQALQRRIEELDPTKDFDELKHLLEALIHADREAGLALAAAVLRGEKKPNPRMRWWAADLLLKFDKPLAQRTLRQILVTESSRGIDPNRSTTGGVLDPAAVASHGFSNFVIRYVASEDPDMDETLLQVLLRNDSDVVSVQECIEVLGKRKCERAAKHIERLFQNPPGAQLNPIFLNKCLDALVSIQGPAARGFLEQQLGKAQTEMVARHIQRALSDLSGGGDQTSPSKDEAPK